MKERKGFGEEIPLVQGKEQWLRFAGAAVKRIPHAPMPEARGGGQEEQPRLEAGAVAGRTNPRSKELWLRGHRRA